MQGVRGHFERYRLHGTVSNQGTPKDVLSLTSSRSKTPKDAYKLTALQYETPENKNCNLDMRAPISAAVGSSELAVSDFTATGVA